MSDLSSQVITTGFNVFNRLFAPFNKLSLDIRKIFTIILIFYSLHIQFIGFATAFIVLNFGTSGALIYVGGLFVFSFCGYSLSIYKISGKKINANVFIRLGLFFQAMVILITSLMPLGWWSIILFSLSGIGYGFSCAINQRLEYEYIKDNTREIYSSLVQSSLALMKAFMPFGLTAVVLLLGISDIYYLIIISLVAIFFAYYFPAPPVLSDAPKIDFNKFKGVFVINKISGYFFIESGTNIIKNTVFIMGIVLLFKTMESYSFVESISSLITGMVLFIISHYSHKSGFGRLSRLRIGVFLMIMAWTALIISFWYQFVFIVFIISFATATPLLAGVRHSLTLKMLKDDSIDASHMAFIREMIILVARILSISIAVSIMIFLDDYKNGIMVISSILLMLLPLEYWLATHLHNFNHGQRKY